MKTSILTFRFLTVLGLLVMVLGDPRATYAFPNTFNPNRVLENSDFSSDMTEANVQAFLTDKGSFFATYTDPAGNGSAALVIRQLARDNGISPRVLLVTAQKESSSISSYRDMNVHIVINGIDYGTRADWFLFCGWTESVINTQYKGFYKQVQCAAQTFGRVFSTGVKSNGKRVGDSEIVDDQTVTYENAATLSLYNYTPHIQNSFFNIWTSYLSNSHFSDGGSPDCPTISDWKGEYWNNRTLSGNPILCRNDGSVDFDWGDGGPGNGVPNDNFSARWTRNWDFTQGRYRFHLRGDDGIRLWVDGNLIIDQWKDQPSTEYTADIDLSGGSHSLKVEYYENGGGASVALWWDSISVNSGNLALNRPAYATSQQGTGYEPYRANDGSTTTRWSSKISTTLGDEWWWVDLGSQSYNTVTIRWETAYATHFYIGWSDDGINFTGYWYDISAPGTYSINIGSHNNRYVGILMRTRAPQMNNYSFWEFEVYSYASTAVPEIDDGTEILLPEGDPINILRIEE